MLNRNENRQMKMCFVSREIWEQAQFLLAEKVKRNVRAAKDCPIHRYSGLLRCGDCGSCFVCKKRIWRNKPVRFEYICNGYHRYGKNACTDHRIGEKALDNLINEELLEIKRMAHEKFESID